VIVALLDVGERMSAASHALAAQLEAMLPATHVHLAELRSGSRASRDRLRHLVREMSPDLLAVGCTIWNIETVLELCDGLHRLAPEIAIALGGMEAVARPALRRLTWARVVEGDAGPALAELLAPRRARRRLRPTTLRRRATDGYASRLAELVRDSVAQHVAVPVEADWGAQLPLCLHAAGAGPDPSLAARCPSALAPDEAAWRIAPLLRAGALARLADPELCGDRRRLGALLRALPAAPPPGGLELALPAELLDERLAALLRAAPVRAIELDLSAAARGALDLDRLRALSASLDQLAVRGELVYGPPAATYPELARGVDGCFSAGVELLDLHRLVAPPGSVLRGQRHLRHAARPPYEVLEQGPGEFDDLLRSVRFATTYSFLRGPFGGTGLLRALAQELGSAAEVIEGFYESLAAEGHDLLEGDPSCSAGRLFLDYLRRHRSVDLELVGGRTQLRRAPFVALRWLPDGRRLIADDSTGRTAHIGRSALALLDRFDQPMTAHEVCERLVAEAPPEVRDKLRGDVHRTLGKLVSMSFLVPAQEPQLEAADDEVPFTCLEEFDFHYRMLSDSARVDAYRRAISTVARPGLHAVEIGTGTGILAVLAAQAGARVTAIERFPVLGIARAVARQSGVSERIQFVRGRSDLVELDEPGDLLITEIVGNRILNEGLLETTLDARRRLLRPGAQLVPRAIEILAEVGHTDRFTHLASEIARVGAEQGVSLEPLTRWFEGRLAAGQVVWELGVDDEDFVTLAEEVPVVRLDLGTMQTAEFARTLVVPAIRGGVANAVLLAFRLELAQGITLSTAGRGHALHWSKPVFMLRRPVELRQGEAFSLTVSYEPHGEITTVVERS